MTGPLALGTGTWTQVPTRAQVLVPIGSTEQHGPHLPFVTDGIIAETAAHAVAASLEQDEWVLAPTLWYGSSGEHQGFPGTMSMGAEALEHVVIELIRSLSTWAERIVFVNGHGGNGIVLARVVPRMRGEGHHVEWVPCFIPDADAHAGRTETSLLLHLRPDVVRHGHREAGNTTPIETLMPLLVEQGVRAVSANGVLGDPTGATAQEGESLFTSLVADLRQRIRGGHRDALGQLVIAGEPR